MIFLHLLFGIILGKFTGNYFYAIIGAILPDIDHIYIIIKNKLYSLNKIIDSIKYEKKYNIKYKTPFMHSISGLILFTSIIFLIDKQNYFIIAISSFSHLILDWPDIDKKYFLYPIKTEFKGFLSILSKTEQIITFIFIIIIFFSYILI